MVRRVVDIMERASRSIAVLHDDISVLRIATVLKALVNSLGHRCRMVGASFDMWHICFLLFSRQTSDREDYSSESSGRVDFQT
jgi:hypothetical protein